MNLKNSLLSLEILCFGQQFIKELYFTFVKSPLNTFD